jgi:DNA polymerase-3 subunit epsilon
MDRDTGQLIDVEFIAFDLETTGLHALTHRIIEIAAVRFRGDGTVLEQFEQSIPAVIFPTRRPRSMAFAIATLPASRPSLRRCLASCNFSVMPRAS